MIEAKAIIADGKGNFKIDATQLQAPQGNEVLVEMKAAGICHTDYDSIKYWDWPFIAGHEGAGIVQAVGNEVTTVAPGDRVILNWAIPCGKCFQCENENTSICESNSPVVNFGKMNGGHVPLERTTYQGQGIMRSFNLGTMSTHSIVRESAVVKMDVDISFAAACIVGCGVMTGVGSVLNAAKVKAGSSVVVLGVGGVGLNVLQGAKIAGANPIIAVDVNPKRLEMSKRFGATHQILASRDDTDLSQAYQKVLKLTKRGADYAFECTGVPALGAAPLLMVRNAGTAVQVSGIEEEITIDMNLFEWDKIYVNPLYGKSNPVVDFPKLLGYYQSGDLLLDELVTRTYPMEELQTAFDDMLAGRNAKGVIVFD